MTRPESLHRREFIGALCSASAGLAAAAVPELSFAADASRAATPESDSLLAAGLTYLNTASLGPTPRAVLERTLEAWLQLESNPVRMSYHDGAVHLASDRAREQMARFIGCAADELLITRSTTDALNCVAQGIRFARGDRILITNQEHEGGTHCWQHVARRQGLELDVVQLAFAEHDPQRIVERIAEALTAKTRVICVSHVFTSNGLRVPVAAIAALARSRGILSVVDGAQALGQLDVNVKALGCDVYAASGHKWLMGPKGTGVLYIRREAEAEIAPVQREDGRRFVTNATGIGALPLVVGMGAAVELMSARGMAAVEKRIHTLRARVFDGLMQIPKLRVMSPPSGSEASGLVACQLPPEVDAQVFHPMLRDKYGLIVKRVESRYFNGIRLSPHVFNTEVEIDFALRCIADEVKG